MELSLPSSSSLSRLHLSPATSSSSSIFHSPFNPFFPLHFNTTRTRTPLLSRIHDTRRNISKHFAVSKEHEQFWLSNEEEEEEDERVYGSEEDDDSLYLSLSEKPDRTMALLDDYEMEELDYTPNHNHRSEFCSVFLSLRVLPIIF